MLGGGQETYNKEPTTKPGTLVNLLVCLAQLWVPYYIRFLDGGGPCVLSVSTSPNWTFGFLTAFVLGLGLGGLDFGLGLDNNKRTGKLKPRAEECLWKFETLA